MKTILILFYFLLLSQSAFLMMTLYYLIQTHALFLSIALFYSFWNLFDIIYCLPCVQVYVYVYLYSPRMILPIFFYNLFKWLCCESISYRQKILDLFWTQSWPCFPFNSSVFLILFWHICDLGLSYFGKMRIRVGFRLGNCQKCFYLIQLVINSYSRDH